VLAKLASGHVHLRAMHERRLEIVCHAGGRCGDWIELRHCLPPMARYRRPLALADGAGAADASPWPAHGRWRRGSRTGRLDVAGSARSAARAPATRAAPSLPATLPTLLRGHCSPIRWRFYASSCSAAADRPCARRSQREPTPAPVDGMVAAAAAISAPSDAHPRRARASASPLAVGVARTPPAPAGCARRVRRAGRRKPVAPRTP